MPRGLDHIAHAVRDLEAAASLYRRLGFTVGARNRHPWGTHNHVVQFPGSFVELLTLAEPGKLGVDGFSRHFGMFNRDFLTRQQGLSLALLESKDIAADHQALTQAGIASSEVMRFEREGKRPDGTSVKVGFSLAFAKDQKSPDIGFAICQQHYPENFWSPAFQSHPNTATGIAGIVLVAEHPAEHHVFLSALTGERDLQSTSSGISIATPRGEIAVLEPRAYARHFGVEPPAVTAGARLAALRFAVRDLGAAKACCDDAGITLVSAMGRLGVGPDQAMGATLVFEMASVR